jgi:hypothetical protein
LIRRQGGKENSISLTSGSASWKKRRRRRAIAILPMASAISAERLTFGSQVHADGAAEAFCLTFARGRSLRTAMTERYRRFMTGRFVAPVAILSGTLALQGSTRTWSPRRAGGDLTGVGVPATMIGRRGGPAAPRRSDLALAMSLPD